VITRNLIVNNSDGIALGQYSNHNTVSQNNISMNDYGFYIESSTQNSIYGNNVLNNAQQAYVASGSLNSWDDGYPSGGNFWGDYVGSDAYSRDYQNETGNDWIGDSPYVVDQNDTDRYPLMHPFSSQANAIEVGYRELLGKYNGLDSQFSSLNSSYYELLKNHTDLRTEFTNQTNAINTLNQSYSTLNFNFTQLNTAYGTLEGRFETLNSSYNNLRNDYNALQQSYNSLNSTFTDNKQSAQNELDFTRNLVYVFIGATAVLIVTTIYVATKKPKTKPET
jgi:parallel beta-helix repeat protein